MKVNEDKTQMLCVNACINNEVNSYIRVSGNEERISSTDRLKILGFNFGREPNAVLHVTTLIEKMYGKLWTLLFLKKSGMKESSLLNIYKDVLRPSAEYSSIVYNTLIPEYLSDKLENMQKQAMKIIYGWNIDYSKVLEDEVISSLKHRRQEASLRFALKASASTRFKKWFPLNPGTQHAVRSTTRKHFLEKKCRTECGRKNPLLAVIRQLNEHMSTIDDRQNISTLE